MTAAASHLDHEAKRKRTMITPEGVALPYTVATRGARAGALILDYGILLVSTVAITLLLIWLVAMAGLDTESESMSGAAEFFIVLFIIFWFLAWNGYFMFFELRPKGATPGKRITRIRVASHDGGRLTAEAIIARNLIRDIELFMPLIFILQAPSGQAGPAGWAGLAWFLLFMFFPFFNKDSLRAGDIIAGTWVVEAPRAKLQQTLSNTGAAAHGSSDVTGVKYEFGDEELSVYGEYELQTLERVLREDNAEALASVADAICLKIGWNPGAGDERAFLEAFYGQLRARLEGDMRFGKRKADKFS